MAHRTIIQSFDWRTLSIKHLFPSLPLRTTANIDETMLEYIETTFGGDWLSVAKRLGADAVSPIHGSPNGNGDWTWTVNTRDYVPMTTRSVVERAHELGMKVVPWTVDDESTVEKLIKLV